MKVIGETLLLLGVNLVDGKKDRLASADQLARQINVRRRHLGASVHHHDDGVSLFERNLGLAENFCRDEIFIFRENAAGVDDAQAASPPFGFAVQTVAGDARFIPDNGPPRTHQPVE